MNVKVSFFFIVELFLNNILVTKRSVMLRNAFQKLDLKATPVIDTSFNFFGPQPTTNFAIWPPKTKRLGTPGVEVYASFQKQLNTNMFLHTLIREAPFVTVSWGTSPTLPLLLFLESSGCPCSL